MASKSKQSLIAIYGPTAVGKSRIAVAVAREVGGEIVSADSMQVYRGLPIITDQPSVEERDGVAHHLISVVELFEEYSAARFARDAAVIIEDICSRDRLPLLVGGTGLYNRALLGGFTFAARGHEESRRGFEEMVRREGLEAGLAQLKRIDPQSAAVIDPHNPRRLIRALEAASAAGPAIAAERERLWSAESPYRLLSFGLFMPREELDRVIEERVERMIAAGALEEVRQVRAGPVSPTAAQAIGYRELCACLDGELTLQQAADTIRQKSRRYARRQLTWMRKMPDIARIDVAAGATGATAAQISERIQSFYGA